MAGRNKIPSAGRCLLDQQSIAKFLGISMLGIAMIDSSELRSGSSDQV